MHIITSLSAALSLACLAACADTTDLTARSWPDPVNPLALSPRQAPNSPERIVQIVQVGDNNGSLKFFPESIRADVGSVVQFQFYPKNHTITESSFAAPCVPIAANLTSPERPGQKSGFIPVAADVAFRPVYNLLVNDTRPMWIFCGQQPHCTKGMAMVINQNMTDPNKTIGKYKEAAAALVPSSAPAPAPPATTAGAPSTVTPPAQTNSNAGPSLVGSTTSAVGAQSGTTSASIGVFTGEAGAKHVPKALALGLVAGAVGMVL